MIRYQLLCEDDHKFEAWFRDSAAYDEQAENGEIECPYCGNVHVRKAVMSPMVASRKDALQQSAQNREQELAIEAADKAAQDVRDGADPREVAEQFMQVVDRLQKHVAETCDYVGEKFADEVRAIHYGDAEERGIYGEASVEDVQDLHEEGIDIMALPSFPNKDKSN